MYCNDYIILFLFIHSQVNLVRSYEFRNSKQTYTGIPVIAANMDTVGTFEMAKVMAKVFNLSICTIFTLHHEIITITFLLSLK